MTRFSVADRVFVHRGVLPGHADQLADDMRCMGDVVPEHLRDARVGFEQGRQDIDGGGLARAIGAEHAVDAAGGHGKVQAINGAVFAENLDQAMCFDGQPL